jgi:peroxiredoxin
MKKFLSIIALMFAVVACKPAANIDIKINGIAEDSIALYKLNINRLTLVDSLKTNKDGECNYKVALTDEKPAFYYLYRGETKLAGMILLPEDKVEITADTLGKYEIAGSIESTNLKYIDDALANSTSAMLKVLNEQPADANQQLSKIYINHKRAMIKHALTNPKSITAATVLFQKFNDNLPVFGEQTDIISFKQIYDSLMVVYPTSEYLTSLKNEIDARENAIAMLKKVNEASSLSYPDITGIDINGKEVSLSSFDGSVIILSFWSVAQTTHKVFNQDLTKLYEKYHKRGLEVFQISLDMDKPTWAAAVKSQNLPWTSICDGLGGDSKSAAAYNIYSVPTMFIIDRNGDINYRDVFDLNELETIIKRLL